MIVQTGMPLLMVDWWSQLRELLSLLLDAWGVLTVVTKVNKLLRVGCSMHPFADGPQGSTSNAHLKEIILYKKLPQIRRWRKPI